MRSIFHVLIPPFHHSFLSFFTSTFAFTFLKLQIHYSTIPTFHFPPVPLNAKHISCAHSTFPSFLSFILYLYLCLYLLKITDTLFHYSNIPPSPVPLNAKHISWDHSNIPFTSKTFSFSNLYFFPDFSQNASPLSSNFSLFPASLTQPIILPGLPTTSA